MIETIEEITAVVLCGGKGERLRPFTESLPKPLVPIHGKPLLHHLLHYLRRSGIRRFRICVGYRAEGIREFLGGLPQADWEIDCVDSGEMAAMTDRLIDAKANGPVLVCYGDTLANVDLARLVGEHRHHGAWGSLTTYPLYSPFGIVEFAGDGRIIDLREKPRLPHWIHIGFVLLEPEALSLLERGLDMVEYLNTLRGTGRLYAYRHEGDHITVNTEKDRQSAEQRMLEFFTIVEG